MTTREDFEKTIKRKASFAGWKRITKYICSLTGEAQTEAVSFASDHMHHWMSYRTLALRWDEMDHPCWPIATSIELDVPENIDIIEVPPMSRHIKTLHLNCSAPSIRGFENLESLEQLEYLFINNGHFSDFQCLQPLVNLRALHLHYFRDVESLESLNGFECLQELEIRQFWALKDISALADLPSLEQLTLCELDELVDLKPVFAVPKLWMLFIQRCPNVLIQPQNAIMRTAEEIEAYHKCWL